MRSAFLPIAASACALWLAGNSGAATVSALFARGYNVIPAPQRVALGPEDFTFGTAWKIEADASASTAVEVLRNGLRERFGLMLSGEGPGVIRIKVKPGSVEVGKALDRNRDALAKQAYRLVLDRTGIAIEANSAAGALYGVETLLQLLRPDGPRLRLPRGQIDDWPDLEIRDIYWDDAHHLEHMDELKRVIRQAAFYKINGFAIKLEGHFQYKSAPALVEPYALSPEQFQELTDYGLRYGVQVIPYLDAPAHVAFILKHPEYSHLREYPDSNYEFCSTNQGTYKLLDGMINDLLDANRGGKYFYLSTDEPYYIGLADSSQCREALRAKELGSVGKLFAEFAAKMGGNLHDRGRTVIFWGEYPMKPDDLPSLPNFLVNGEVYGPEYDAIYRKQGIRQMVYTSSEGEERLFPDYFVEPAPQRLHGAYAGRPRVQEAFEKIAFDSSRRNADLIGSVNAGWGDMGLHPETFWLGYIAASAAAWHPGAPDPRETMASFYPLFYGPDVVDMDHVYQLMSGQAQFWADSWDRTASKSRKGIWGDSANIFHPRHPAHDQTLPLPPAPSGDLSYASTWAKENARRLELAGKAAQDNDLLVGLLRENLQRARFNRYNLAVFLSIARLCRQNTDMLDGIRRMNDLLTQAAKSRTRDANDSLASVDEALDIADQIRRERNRVFSDTVATWYKSWLPRVKEANGRTFLHELDDVKDHLPDRTVDMSYLVYREKLLPFGEWVNSIAAARHTFARAHNLPERNFHFDWEDLTPRSYP